MYSILLTQEAYSRSDNSNCLYYLYLKLVQGRVRLSSNVCSGLQVLLLYLAQEMVSEGDGTKRNSVSFKSYCFCLFVCLVLFCFQSTSCLQSPSRQRSNRQKCKQRLIISHFIEKQLSLVKENFLLFSVLAMVCNNLLMFLDLPEKFPTKNANQIVLKIFCL